MHLTALIIIINILFSILQNILLFTFISIFDTFRILFHVVNVHAMHYVIPTYAWNYMFRATKTLY